MNQNNQGSGRQNGNGGTGRNGNGKRASVQQIHCAIYTRKSTEEGLEQEFNTLDAQRESAEAYIVSQQHEGWVCLPDRYDDGVCTGANMERPALRRLMADIEAGKVDCVLVYKVDRFSRSLMDFARMMETFEKHKIAFVSVTQQFNTAIPMGLLFCGPCGHGMSPGTRLDDEDERGMHFNHILRLVGRVGSCCPVGRLLCIG